MAPNNVQKILDAVKKEAETLYTNKRILEHAEFDVEEATRKYNKALFTQCLETGLLKTLKWMRYKGTYAALLQGDIEYLKFDTGTECYVDVDDVLVKITHDLIILGGDTEAAIRFMTNHDLTEAK